jgi:hypothetical protein
MELSKKLGFTYNWIKDKKGTLDSHAPQKKTFDDLFNRLTERYQDLLNDSWVHTENMFQNLYDIAFPNDSMLPSTTTDLNLKMIFSNYFPDIRIFDTDISRIFFNRARALKDSHLKGTYEFRKLELSTLFSIIYKSRSLSKKLVVNNVRDIKEIDKITLLKIKADIENYIIDFIFSNPFEEKYISEEHIIGTSYYKPEFYLTLDIWFELSKINKNPMLLKIVRRNLKYETYGRINRFGLPTKGNGYSWKGLMNMLNRLTILLPGAPYSKIFEKVWKYVEERYLYPALPRKYHPDWYSPSTVKFHIIILLIRDLGLDILNLEPINPIAFKKTEIMESTTYERHHIYINDKLSIDVNRLVLVMHRNHSKLEGRTNLILDLIQNRTDLSFECPEYYKTNLKNWEDKWQEYLKRRTFLIEYGIANFIKEFFTDKHGNNYIIDRFLKYVPFHKIDQNITSIIQEWIDKNRPAPILNTYILNRLINGTPKLLTSGYLKLKA